MSRIVQIGLVATVLAIAAMAQAQTQPNVQVTVRPPDESPGAPQSNPTVGKVVVQGETGALSPDPDKVVCRNQPVTGSRFKRRVCLTQARWDAWAKQSDAYLYNLQRQSTLGMPAVPGQLNK
jgi:hypothetical protein